MSFMTGFAGGANQGLAIRKFQDDREWRDEQSRLAAEELEYRKEQDAINNFVNDAKMAQWAESHAFDRERFAADEKQRGIQNKHNSRLARVSERNASVNEQTNKRAQDEADLKEQARFFGNGLIAWNSGELKYGDNSPEWYGSTEYRLIANDMLNNPHMRKNMSVFMRELDGKEIGQEVTPEGIRIHFERQDGSKGALTMPHDVFEATAFHTMRGFGAHDVTNEVTAMVGANYGQQMSVDEAAATSQQAAQEGAALLDNYVDNLDQFVEVETPSAPTAQTSQADAPSVPPEIMANYTKYADRGDKRRMKFIEDRFPEAAELYAHQKANPVDDTSARRERLQNNVSTLSGHAKRNAQAQLDALPASEPEVKKEVETVRLSSSKVKQYEREAEKMNVGVPQAKAIEKVFDGTAVKKERETALKAYINMQRSLGLNPDQNMMQRFASGDYRSDAQVATDKALLDAELSVYKEMKKEGFKNKGESIKSQRKVNEKFLDGIGAQINPDNKEAGFASLVEVITSSNNPWRARGFVDVASLYDSDPAVLADMVTEAKEVLKTQRANESSWSGTDLGARDLTWRDAPSVTSKEAQAELSRYNFDDDDIAELERLAGSDDPRALLHALKQIQNEG